MALCGIHEDTVSFHVHVREVSTVELIHVVCPNVIEQADLNPPILINAHKRPSLRSGSLVTISRASERSLYLL